MRERIRHLDTTQLTTEMAKPVSNRRTKLWTRAVLPVALVAGLSAGCASAPNSPDQPGTSPSITQTENPSVSMPSISEFLHRYESDPFMRTHGTDYISSSSMSSHYSDRDFIRWMNHDEAGRETNLRGPLYTAPVLEIRYNRQNDQLVYSSQSSEPLEDADIYSLLQPIAANDLIMKSAFRKGTLDRFVVRLTKPGIGTDNADFDGEYVIEDRTDPTKPPQKSVFFYLPSSGNISHEEYMALAQHEGLHGLTSVNTLSDDNDSPSLQDRAAWTQVCSDIRNFAIDEAEHNIATIMRNMEFTKNNITDPAAREAYDDVMTALRSGDFNILQQQPGEVYSRFSEEVPECSAIGPWQAFYHLAEKRGIDTSPYRPSGMDESFIDDVNRLDNAWANVIENITIYRIFKESTFVPGSREPATGHPEENWDELATSTANVAVNFPDRLRIFMDRLPDNQKPAARTLIERSLTDIRDAFLQEPALGNMLNQRLATIIG